MSISEPPAICGQNPPRGRAVIGGNPVGGAQRHRREYAGQLTESRRRDQPANVKEPENSTGQRSKVRPRCT